MSYVGISHYTLHLQWNCRIVIMRAMLRKQQ